MVVWLAVVVVDDFAAVAFHDALCMMLHFSSQSNVVYPANWRYSSSVGKGAPVYVAGVLEFLSAEMLELAGNASRENKKSWLG